MRLILAGIASLIAACSRGDGVSPGTDGLVEHQLRPSATNPAIGEWNDAHYAVAGAHPSRSELMVVLPGTNGKPDNAKLFARTAATEGYHVIGLMYADDIAVVSVCLDASDLTCMEDVRIEVITGEDRSSFVHVDRANSIEGRLNAALRYLDEHYPAEGWGAYVAEGELLWNRIAVAGLSQGGGHAAMIGKLHSVARVIMFGAPADGFDGQAAAWMAIGETPAAKYFGFAHVRDQFSSIVPNWRALGLDAFGPVALVESSDTLYAGSHMLRTDLLPATGSYLNAHGSVFVDALTPRDAAGVPVLSSAWRYLLTSGPAR